MDIEFVAAEAPTPPNSAHALVVFEGQLLAGAAAAADEATGGTLTRALAAARFTGAKGQVLDVPAPPKVKAARLLLVGAGKPEAFGDVGAEHAAAAAYNAVKASGLATLRIEAPEAARPAHMALGARLAAYRFDRYKTKEPADRKPSVTMTQVVAGDVDKALAAFAPLSAVADAVAFARDLVSEPANILYPAEFARRVKALEGLGLEVEVLGEAEMTELGMNALLAVGQGSVRESQLVVMQWKGGGKGAPIAFVGKGVCFDTGGISIKPADGMEDMKWDMGGAAAVAGAMHALAGRKAKVNAVGVLGLVENMPDGMAQRPGDIVTSMSGQTIEVINTDAEGRLVLADALWYCQQRFKPKFMIDLATLTGAIIVALGHDYGGLFSNNDELAANLLAAASAEDEPLWRMPLPAQYEKGLESLAADMRNVGARPGGSITAALFIQKFVGGLPWAHLDIASTAWKKPSSTPTIPEGATGFGVRLLNRLVADKYEK
jgi:leucyl aminopeptidase